MSEIRFPTKTLDHHKGAKGKLLIIGGSKRYYGSPIYNVLGAEAAGVDLIYLHLPKEHLEAVKMHSLNVFLTPFVQGDLGLRDLGLITSNMNNVNAILMGSGVDGDRDTERAVMEIITASDKPLILDAGALKIEFISITTKIPKVITPHKGEFKRLFNIEPTEENVTHMARKHNLVILLKSQVDIITDGDSTFMNHTGCAQMSVGGTGDVLAGITAGLMSRGLSAYESCVIAAETFGDAGMALYKQSRCFTSLDLAKYFSKHLALIQPE